MRNKPNRRTRKNTMEVEDFLARVEGSQQKKKWTHHDMRRIAAKTERQSLAMAAYKDGHNLALLGSAGCGKTLIAMYLAFGELLSGSSDIRKVLLVRNTVQGREQGFLPGTLDEKEKPFTQTFKGKLEELFGRSKTFDDMVSAGLVEFHSTSFLRGATWDDSIVIIDEAQNCNFHEINSVITRLGRNSRLIVCGDTRQCDLSGRGLDITGLDAFQKVAESISCFTVIDFLPADCVRSGFVREWLHAVEAHTLSLRTPPASSRVAQAPRLFEGSDTRTM